MTTFKEMTRTATKIVYGNKGLERLDNVFCPDCGDKIEEDKFRDKLSYQEYLISGMCQKCQDKVFGEY